jgi:hypothetical protein
MCRYQVDPDVQGQLVMVMGLLRDGLADRYGVDPGGIRVGPVDFGAPNSVDDATPRV